MHRSAYGQRGSHFSTKGVMSLEEQCVFPVWDVTARPTIMNRNLVMIEDLYPWLKLIVQ